ncbi:glycerate kinase [Verrucomicrobium sp. GAS474]|uniref:glycerate kinase n=1 Tax=Verrucomicrobium sp. GAS474 TaxID=1882831 RepID=UPI00087D461D|nr:glycerate kinase [Verrucomicrobium sp. GAS474]SDT87590.1 glycerate kinase [Verrucomicrobium sp. GAS474]
MPSPRAFLLVPDKFKGTLTASAAARALALGLRRADPRARVAALPLSDGGEGFVETLCRARGGTLHRIDSIDPLGRRCRAAFAVLPDGTAVVGLTEASGLWRVPVPRRDPGTTTTVGTGRLMREAVRRMGRGCRRLIVGIGGSATNDGGIGLASAFGFRFLDARGRPIPLTGEGLAQLEKIVPPSRLPQVEVIVACDVNHPLYGPHGAARQFAAQKFPVKDEVGEETIARLDANLRRLARVAEACLGRSAHRRAGAGAAGGCGYGLMTFLGARRVSGFDVFAKASGLREAIAQHDVVITGEGCFDRTSLGGKGPSAVGTMALRAGKKAWLVCGKCLLTKAERKASPFEKIVELVELAPTPKKALADAGRYVEEAGRRLASASL